MSVLYSPSIMFPSERSSEQLQEENRRLQRQVLDLSAAVSRLKETSDMYRIVADTAADAILCLDDQNRIIYANPNTKQLTGYDPARLIGKPLTVLIPEQYQDNHLAGFRRFLEEEQTTIPWTGVELMIQHKDGSQIPVEVSFGAVKGEDRHYRFTGFLRDSRPRKRLEEISRERQAALTHANRLKSVGELAAGLAHELNQPLSAVCLHADLALEFFTDVAMQTQVSESLETIVSQSQRAASIIHLLRELIRKNEPKHEPVQINEAIQAVLQLIKGELTTRQIRLELELEESLPLVNADRIQIEQIVLNLLQNAIEAIHAAEGKVRRIHIRTFSDDHHVRAEVCDTGTGLPADPHQVFQNFFSTKSTGLGIGLGICSSIAEMHRGQMSARNNEETGACFTLQLPLPAAAGGIE